MAVRDPRLFSNRSSKTEYIRAKGRVEADGTASNAGECPAPYQRRPEGERRGQQGNRQAKRD